MPTRRFSRLVPVLLPPLAGIICFTLANLKGKGGGHGNRGGSPESGILRDAAAGQRAGMGAGDLVELEKLRELERRMESAAEVTALAGIWAEARDGLRGELMRNRLFQRIYGRMLDLDPVAAWAWVRAFPDEVPPPQMDFLRIWGGRDPSAAGTVVMKLAAGRESSLYQVAAGWAVADPAGFLKTGTPEGWKMVQAQWTSLEKNALDSLAGTDLPQALALAPKYLADDRYDSRDVFRRMADRMTEERGIEKAVAWAKSLKDYPDTVRAKLLAELLPSLAGKDPRRAAEELSGVASHWTQDAAALIAGQWAAKEPGEALKWALSLGPNAMGSNASGESALMKIGETIGPDADALLRAAEGVTFQPGLGSRAWAFKLFPLLQGTGISDPAKLTAGLAAAPPGGMQSALLSASLLQWSRVDPMAAFQFLPKVPEGSAALSKEVLTENLGPGGFREFSPEKTVEFIRLVREDPALSKVESAWGWAEVWKMAASRDPLATLALLEESPGSPGAGANPGSRAQPERVDFKAWSAVFSSWAGTDPHAAAAQALGLPEEKRAPAVEGLIGAWSEFDPMAASVWAGALPPGAGREAAAASLTQALTPVEPSSAFEWALSLDDSVQRRTLLENLFQSWSREDAAEARQSLEASALSPENRELLLNVIRKSSP